MTKFVFRQKDYKIRQKKYKIRQTKKLLGVEYCWKYSVSTNTSSERVADWNGDNVEGSAVDKGASFRKFFSPFSSVSF